MKMKKRKVCCVFNYYPLYRYPIYKSIADTFQAEFYFGDNVFQPLKTFDPNMLPGFQRLIKAMKTPFKGYIWHSGIGPIFNRNYTHYILTGDSGCLVNWLIIIYAKLTGKNVYLWCHGLKDDVKNSLLLVYYKLFFCNVTGILLYSEYSISYMKKLGCKGDRLFVIHNSLDSELQSTIYMSLQKTDVYIQHFRNNNPTIIYIGRVQKKKKVHLIIESMALLREHGKLINLVIVGANVDDDSLCQSIRKNKIEQQVWLYGPCFDESRNAELLYNAAVCVSPGNVGLTSIHSLSYGTPVITNDNFHRQMPEFEAIVDGKTGSFFKEDNVTDLALKIDHWTSIADDERILVRKVARETILDEWCIDYQISLLSKVLK